jgi:hypothetical protein
LAAARVIASAMSDWVINASSPLGTNRTISDRLGVVGSPRYSAVPVAQLQFEGSVISPVPR